MEKLWTRFSVGTPSKFKGLTNSNCVPFSIVSHVAHIDKAINILKAGYLSAGLIFDESRLNTQRILVNWLSPNHWAYGFRYGNIKFDFSFEELIQDKNYYWVESIAYGIPACRIMITEDHYEFLQEYHPNEREGPWYNTQTGENYFNNNYCLEFMLDGNLELSNNVKIHFVDHHREYCSENRREPSLCNELGMKAHRAGAIFTSKLIASPQEINPNLFIDQEKPSFDLLNAWYDFGVKCLKINGEVNGNLDSTNPGSIPLARALFSSFSNGLDSEFEVLASNFRNTDELIISCAILFSKVFCIEDYNILINELD